MKKTEILIFVLCIFAFNGYAQKINSTNQVSPTSDELLKHLSAAETYQISGDLSNAAVENRAILGIALQRVGNVAIEEGNYDEAVKLLNESIIFADSAPNRTNLALAYQHLNQIDKAIIEAEKAVSMDPKFAGGHYLLGSIYFSKEDYQSALPYLEKVLQMAPDFEAAQALGLTYLYLKQPERAKLLYDEVQLSSGKENANLHIIFARAYQRTNYPLEAERELKRALELNPKMSRTNFFLGFLILEQGGSERIAEAGTAFEAELKLNPNDFFSTFFVGVVASSDNQHEKAIQYLQKAIGMNPKSGEANLFLAQSQIELNNLVEAEKNLRRAVEIETADKKDLYQARRTHFLLGRVLLKTGRKEESEKELAIASQLQKQSLVSAREEINQILGQVVNQNTDKVKNPTAEKVILPSERVTELNNIKVYLNDILAQAFHNLGVIAVQTGQTGDALANFEAASKWKPDFPGLNRNWGIVSFRANQFDKAIAPLSRHLKSNPNDNLVRRMLGLSYYFTKDFAKSVETLKPLEAIITSDAELAYFYGISLIQQKRNQEAIAIFAKIAEMSQTKPEALFYAAQGFMILGDYQKAVKEFQQVVSLNPKTEKANYFIGQSLIRLNRYDEAEKAFIRELAINPTDVLSKYHLALTLIERKVEPQRTISILEEVIALKYDYADARYQLGKIYLEKGETAKAIEQLEIAVSADANKDYIHYQLSIAYRKFLRKDDADRELKRYQELKATNRKTDAPM